MRRSYAFWLAFFGCSLLVFQFVNAAQSTSVPMERVAARQATPAAGDDFGDDGAIDFEDDFAIDDGDNCLRPRLRFELKPERSLDDEAMERTRDALDRRIVAFDGIADPHSAVAFSDDRRHFLVDLTVHGGIDQVRWVLTTRAHLEVIDPLEQTLGLDTPVETGGEDPLVWLVGTPGAVGPTASPTVASMTFPTLLDNRALDDPYASERGGQHFVVADVLPDGASALATFAARRQPEPAVVLLDNVVIDSDPDILDDYRAIAIQMQSREEAEQLAVALHSVPLISPLSVVRVDEFPCG